MSNRLLIFLHYNCILLLLITYIIYSNIPYNDNINTIVLTIR